MLLMLPFLKCSIAYQVFLQVFFMQYLQNKEKEKITVSKESNQSKNKPISEKCKRENLKNLDPKADFCSFNNYVMLNLLFWLPKYSPKRLLSKKKSSFFLSITSDNHAHNFSSSDACLVTPKPSKLIFTPLISILF